MPAKVRSLHGERRPSRIRPEPQPADREPEKPEWLSREAAEVWDRTVEDLADMGLAYRADVGLLAAYASSCAKFAEAERALATEGIVYTDRNHQKRRNPWLLVRKDALDSLTRIAGQLGLSPAARVHLPTKPQDDEADRLAARLLT